MICKPLSNKTPDLGGPKVAFPRILELPFVKSFSVVQCFCATETCNFALAGWTYAHLLLRRCSFTKWELNSECALLVLVPCFCAGSDDFLQQFDTADIASAVAAATGQHAWGLSFLFQWKSGEDLWRSVAWSCQDEPPLPPPSDEPEEAGLQDS